MMRQWVDRWMVRQIDIDTYRYRYRYMQKEAHSQKYIGIRRYIDTYRGIEIDINMNGRVD